MRIPAEPNEDPDLVLARCAEHIRNEATRQRRREWEVAEKAAQFAWDFGLMNSSREAGVVRDAIAYATGSEAEVGGSDV